MKQRPASKDDKRISRFHQMEQMEAAARGTAPSLTLDMGDMRQESTRPRTPPPSIPTSATSRPTETPLAFEEGITNSEGTFDDGEGDFLAPLVMRNLHAAAGGASNRSPMITGNFFSQREKYQVDQSINLMDASSKPYSVDSHGNHHHHEYATSTSSKRNSRNRASFVDIFMGGSGITSGSGSSSKGNVTTTWRSSAFGKIIIICFLLAFVALLTLSVPFLVTTDNNEDETAKSGPETDADIVTAAENVDRFEILKKALLKQQATSIDRLQNSTSSAFRALQWLTDDDSAQLSSTDPHLAARFALATFFYATGFSQQHRANTERDVADASWTRADRWLSQDAVCTWYGVDCDGDDDQKVVHLNVTHNGLEGTIPMELQSLTDLILLDLSKNRLSGTIPGSMVETLMKLKYFLMENNELSGKIPSELGRLDSIFEIYLSFNKLTGTVPESITKLSSLRALYLTNNLLSGSIPDITGLKDINYLQLSSNTLSGSLPLSISKLTMLYDLRLDNNHISGTIPQEMANDGRLRLLYLGNNKLTGSIPDMFDQLNALTDLQLHGNSLKSKLPATMGYLTSLRRMTLEGNLMTGSVPTEWGGMTDLEALELWHNELVGRIPSEFGEMTNLRNVGLGHNFLQGQIPSELGQLTRLKTLEIQHNALKGVLPTQLGKLESLERLDLVETMVTGTMPEEICDLTKQHQLKVLQADCRSELKCLCCTLCQ